MKNGGSCHQTIFPNRLIVSLPFLIRNDFGDGLSAMLYSLKTHQLLRFQSGKFDQVPDFQRVGAAKLLPPVGQPSREEVVSPGRHVFDAPALARAVDQSHEKVFCKLSTVMCQGNILSRLFVFIAVAVGVIVVEANASV